VKKLITDVRERLRLSIYLQKIHINPEQYPIKSYYPFTLKILEQTGSLEFQSPVTFFVGENGSGKSTLIKAICQRCGIHTREETERRRFQHNPYENEFHLFLIYQYFFPN